MSEMLVLDLPEAPEPEMALDRLNGMEGRVLLRSAGEGGEYSFLAASPLDTVAIRVGEDPFSRLETFLERWKGGTELGSEHHPFAGGVLGFLSYEAGDVLERLPQSQIDDIGVPLGWFGAYEYGALWDPGTGRCRVLATLLRGRSIAEVRREMELFADRILTPVPQREERRGARVRGGAGGAGDAIAGRDGAGGAGGAIAGLDGAGGAGGAIAVRDGAGGAGGAIAGLDGRVGRNAVGQSSRTSLSRSEFMAGVQRIREYILAGDLFQANLTRRISAPTSLSGTELFHRLLRESPAPFSAYLDCGDLEIASISPELFLSLRGRAVRTSPIKGTAPRGATPEEDQLLRHGLAESEKNRAENIMIVDLLRNDLSKVSLPGTIAVPRLAEVETHPTVHHLVSTVTGTLAPEVAIVDLLRATFPGGSITGAPKIRAMEILRELEPVQRGVYTGAIGIVGFGGDADFSIAIRTTTLRDGVAHYGTGGGITLASTPEEEWIETEEKAKAFLRAMAVE